MEETQVGRRCGIDGCLLPWHCRDWCKRHYERQRTTGDPLTPLKPPGKPKQEFPLGCGFSFDGVRCGKPVVYVRLALCRGHEKQHEMGKALAPLERRRRIADGTKECSGCGVVLPLSSFHRSSNRSPVVSRCRDCASIDHRVGRYSLPPETVRLMMAMPCGGCGATGLSGHHLHFDHDHRCCPGKTSCGRCVRGVLCTHCNQIVKDHATPDLLRRLADYVESFNF